MKALRILMYSSLCFWPLAHLQSESKKPVIVQNKLCLLRSWQCQTVIKSGVICVNPKLLLPLPKCLHTKASPRIIWPHRNIHPHPVSDVGPVPPATHHAGDPLFVIYVNVQITQISRVVKCCRGANTSSLTNWWEVFSVCEPQSWSDIW